MANYALVELLPGGKYQAFEGEYLNEPVSEDKACRLFAKFEEMCKVVQVVSHDDEES